MKTEHLVVRTERMAQTHIFTRVAHTLDQGTCVGPRSRICGLLLPACISKVSQSSHVSWNFAWVTILFALTFLYISLHIFSNIYTPNPMSTPSQLNSSTSPNPVPLRKEVSSLAAWPSRALSQMRESKKNRSHFGLCGHNCSIFRWQQGDCGKAVSLLFMCWSSYHPRCCFCVLSHEAADDVWTVSPTSLVFPGWLEPEARRVVVR